MGYLDDLKKNAAEARSQEEARQRQLAEREGVYSGRIRPIMLRAMSTLRELTEHLALLPEGIEMAFEFPVLGRMDGLVQQNHRINVDSTERPTRIALSFDAHQSMVRRLPVEARDVNEITRFLDGQRIRSVSWPLREGDRNQIVIEAQFGVRAQIELVADFEASRIVVEIYNFHEPGHEAIPYTLEVAETEDWLDRICGYLLCKIDTLTPRRGLSEHERLRLQQTLDDASARARIFEEERDRAEQAASEAAEAERAAQGKVKGLLTRIAPGLLRKP